MFVPHEVLSHTHTKNKPRRISPLGPALMSLFCNPTRTRQRCCRQARAAPNPDRDTTNAAGRRRRRPISTERDNIYRARYVDGAHCRRRCRRRRAGRKRSGRISSDALACKAGPPSLSAKGARWRRGPRPLAGRERQGQG